MDYEKAFHAQTTIVNAVRDAHRIDADVLQLVCEQVCAVLDAHNVIVMELKTHGPAEFEMVAHARPLDERTQYAEAYIREDYEGESFTRDDAYVFALNEAIAMGIVTLSEYGKLEQDFLHNIAYCLTQKLLLSEFVQLSTVLPPAIRNAINPVEGWSKILTQLPTEKLTEELKITPADGLAAISRNSRQAIYLAYIQRNFARFRIGYRYEFQQADISKILFHIRDVERFVRITDIALDTPDLRLAADDPALYLCFMAILHNSTRFTPGDGQINVKVSDDTEREGNILISVADTGDGISENDSNLYLPFHSGSNNTSLNHGIAGLGLYFAREIVKAHHGHIWYESEIDKGSTFYVSLPRTQPQ